MSLIRTDTFVPLAPAVVASAGNTQTRVTILSQAAQARPFRPLEGRAAGSVVSPTAAVPIHACEPKVTLQRDGDRVTMIEVRCSCGQTLELACVYPEA